VRFLRWLWALVLLALLQWGALQDPCPPLTLPKPALTPEEILMSIKADLAAIGDLIVGLGAKVSAYVSARDAGQAAAVAAAVDATKAEEAAALATAQAASEAAAVQAKADADAAQAAAVEAAVAANEADNQGVVDGLKASVATLQAQLDALSASA
jgi:hypothetical protein